jgi:hypothetical protein
LNQKHQRILVWLSFAFFIAVFRELIDVKDHHGEFSFVTVFLDVAFFAVLGFLAIKIRGK